jgi:hypothetical protein
MASCLPSQQARFIRKRWCSGHSAAPRHNGALDLRGGDANFLGVNTNTLARLTLLLVAVVSSAFAGSTKVLSMGDNTYSVTREAPHTFNRDTDALKAAAMQEAEKFCQEQGKQLKVVNWSIYRPRFISGYASAKLVFKTLNPGDSELTSEPAPLPSSGAIAAGSNDLYSELLKLDDLRKKGILSDKEFESEKKKALKRAR